jgi:16S rRNA (cytosine1402-N4)-methyltransferase
VNYELLNIKRGLASVPDIMEKHGLLFVISFHSLEDKLVKKMLIHYDKLGLGVQPYKKMTPTAEEIEENPRSKSAILRVFRFN